MVYQSVGFNHQINQKIMFNQQQKIKKSLL